MKFRVAGIQEVRDTMGPVTDRAFYGREFTTITRRGKPAAAIVSTEWAALPDRMAAILAPIAICEEHPLRDEIPARCPLCLIRRVYLDYLKAGGTDTQFSALPSRGDPPVGGSLRLPQRNQDGTVYQPGKEA